MINQLSSNIQVFYWLWCMLGGYKYEWHLSQVALGLYGSTSVHANKPKYKQELWEAILTCIVLSDLIRCWLKGPDSYSSLWLYRVKNDPSLCGRWLWYWHIIKKEKKKLTQFFLLWHALFPNETHIYTDLLAWGLSQGLAWICYLVYLFCLVV